MSSAVVVDAPVGDGPVRWAPGASFVDGGEAVGFGLKVDHGADVTERAVHVDDDRGLSVHWVEGWLKTSSDAF